MLSIPRPLSSYRAVPRAAEHRHPVFFCATILQTHRVPPLPHTRAAGGSRRPGPAIARGHLFLSARSPPPPNAPGFFARRAVGSRRRCALASAYSFLVPSVQPASTVAAAASVKTGLAAASSAAFLAASAA